MAKFANFISERNPNSVLIVDAMNLAFRWKHQNKLDFEYDYTDANDDRKNSSLLGNNNFRDSYFSIVTESIAWGDSIFISEKLF